MVESIIQKNNEFLLQKFLNNVNYVDFNYFGIDSNNEITVTGSKAIKNSVIMWLFSRKGDYYDNPTKGGVLDNLSVGDLLRNNRISDLENKIKEEFKKDFPEYILLDLCDVTFEGNTIRIQLRVIDILIKSFADFNIKLED